MKKIVYLLSAILLTVSMQLSAEDVFYVSISGNDSNPGTETSPWYSLNASKWTDGCIVKISGEVYTSELSEVKAKSVTLEGITADAAIAALDDDEFEDEANISGFQLFNVGDDNDEAELTIKNLTIKNVRREDKNANGGMIYVGLLGTLNLENAVLKNFESTIQSFGGAVQCNGKIYATNCTFENNSCMYGGAVQIQESEEPVEGIFENCVFKNNKADVYDNGDGGETTYSQGGAVSMQAIKRGNFKFDNCYFDGNQSNKHLGGAMIFAMPNNAENVNITLNITNCTFTNNYSIRTGGAIAFNGSPTSGNLDFTIANCTFYENKIGDQHGVAVTTASMGGPNSKEEVTGTHIFANNTFFRNTRDMESGYSAVFLYGQKGSDLVFVNNLILEETWAGSQGITVEPGQQLNGDVYEALYNYKSYTVKNNIFGRVGGSHYAYWETGFRVEVNNLENANRELTDAKDEVGWSVQPEEKAEIVGLATDLTVPATGAPYMKLIDKDGLAVDFGISSLTVNGANVVPQTDVAGNAIYGTYRDAGAYEYNEGSNIGAIKEQKSVYFYPVPFNEKLYLADGIIAVAIYDVSGVCALSADNVSVVNTSDLTSGIYIVKVTDKSGKEFVQKAMKK